MTQNYQQQVRLLAAESLRAERFVSHRVIVGAISRPD